MSAFSEFLQRVLRSIGWWDGTGRTFRVWEGGREDVNIWDT